MKRTRLCGVSIVTRSSLIRSQWLQWNTMRKQLVVMKLALSVHIDLALCYFQYIFHISVPTWFPYVCHTFPSSHLHCDLKKFRFQSCLTALFRQPTVKVATFPKFCGFCIFRTICGVNNWRIFYPRPVAKVNLFTRVELLAQKCNLLRIFKTLFLVVRSQLWKLGHSSVIFMFRFCKYSIFSLFIKWKLYMH